MKLTKISGLTLGIVISIISSIIMYSFFMGPRPNSGILEIIVATLSYATAIPFLVIGSIGAVMFITSGISGLIGKHKNESSSKISDYVFLIVFPIIAVIHISSDYFYNRIVIENHTKKVTEIKSLITNISNETFTKATWTPFIEKYKDITGHELVRNFQSPEDLISYAENNESIFSNLKNTPRHFDLALYIYFNKKEQSTFAIKFERDLYLSDNCIVFTNPLNENIVTDMICKGHIDLKENSFKEDLRDLRMIQGNEPNLDILIVNHGDLASFARYSEQATSHGLMISSCYNLSIESLNKYFTLTNNSDCKSFRFQDKTIIFPKELINE